MATKPTAPALTTEQRSAALAKAAAARTARAQVRADLKSGRLDLAAVLARAEQDELIAGLRVTALLDALPGYGSARSAALLDEVGIAPTRRIRGLGPNQRAALLAAAVNR